MAIKALASFQQANAAAAAMWPNGSDGQAWARLSGPTGSLYSITNLEGVLTGFSTAIVVAYGSTTAGNFRLLTRLNIQHSVNTAVALIARAADGSNFYRARVKSGNLDVHVVVAGVATQIGTGAFTLTPGSQFYYLEFMGIGSTLQAKVWPDDGSGEPATWTVPAFTDGTFTTGQFGISVLPNNTSEVISIDSFSCTDGVTSSSLVIDGPYEFTLFANGSSPANPPAQLFTDLVALKNKAGCATLRYQMGWRKLENNPASLVTDPPTNTPGYNATNLAVLDYVVSQCNALGINLLLTLQDCPDNYAIWNDNNTYGGSSGALPAASGMVRYARFIADRYNGFTGHGSVQSLQIRNEEDDTVQGRTGQALAPAVNLCYPAIQAIYPGCDVGFCAVRKMPVGASAHITTWTTTVLSALTCKPNWCDFHEYREGTCSADPTVACTDSSQVPSVSGEIALIDAVIQTYQPTMKIRCNETGWQIGVVVAGVLITEVLRSQYILDMYDAGRFSPGVVCDHVGVYTLDNAGDKDNITSSSSPTWGNILTYGGEYPQWGVSLPVPPSDRIVRGRDGALVARGPSGSQLACGRSQSKAISVCGRDGVQLVRGRDGSVLVRGH